MSNITNHGNWVAYRPDPMPYGVPVHTMFCKRENDGADWYEFHPSLNADTVKCTVLENIVRAVYRDASKLFPQSCTLLEIYDMDTADPQKKYGGMTYDPATNTLV